MLTQAAATPARRVAAALLGPRPARRVAAAMLVATPLVLIASNGRSVEANPADPPQPTVALSATPQRLDLLPHPCLPAALTVGFQAAEPTYTTAFIRADDPLRVSRDTFTTYVPAGYAGTVAVGVTVPRGTTPGAYEIRLEAGRETVSVPVTVAPLPTDPNRNLAFGQDTTASTSGGLLSPCGVVDGDRSYTLLGYNRPPTAWADETPNAFPDQVETTLAEPARVGRVDLYTHAQQRFALKDWDVQVRTEAGWQTVAQVRGHTAGLASSRFDPVTASAVRIVVLATNGYAYSTVTELEVYAG